MLCQLWLQYSEMSQEIASSVMREAELDTEVPLMEETSPLGGDEDRAGKPAERETALKADRLVSKPEAGGVGHRRKHGDLGDRGLSLDDLSVLEHLLFQGWSLKDLSLFEDYSLGPDA